jgi:beta-galactosidase/beta-glucuronidase
VRKSEITWDAALEGLDARSSYTLHVEMLRDDRPLASFDGPAFTAADLRGGRFAFTTPWKPDRLWYLHTPGHMETARISLRDARGAMLDTSWDRRFGFRELEIVGRDFVLNGSRIYLCAVPLDNAQVSAALATYDAARESLERLKSFGVNFVYTHNYGCEPGSHLAFGEILRAADDAGVLVSFSQPHFSHYDW